MRLLRMSDARDEDTAGVDRQNIDTLNLCERMGWDDGGVYVENDTSAFKRKRILLPDGSTGLRTVRPEFRRIITDLQAGVGNAIAAYDLDRVARDPRDLEDLIDIVEQTGAPAKSVTGSLDLSTDAGVTMARVMVAIANKSSRDTARRVARKHEDLAEAGKVGGGGRRAFGWERDGITPIDHEIEAIKAMAGYYLEGKSLEQICRLLDAANVPTVKGGRWHGKSVATILKSARAAGLREHRGEIVGPAVWPAALERDVWDQVQDALRERVTARPNGFQRWLTGVLFCGRPECRHRMRGWSDRGAQIYWCPNLPDDPGCGRVSARAARVEERVEDLLLAFFADPSNVANLRAVNEATGQDAAASARQEAADGAAQLKALAAMWGRRELTMAEWIEARREINARMKRAQAVVQASFPSAVRELLAAEDIAARWMTMPPMHRREVARIVFPDGILIMPVGGHGPVFDVSRVQPVRQLV